MKKLIKFSAFIMLLLFSGSIILFGIAVFAQYWLSHKYEEAYYQERAQLGLQPISPKWHKEKITLTDWFETSSPNYSNPEIFIIEKYASFLTGGSLITYTIFKPPKAKSANYLHRNKIIWYSVSILPWKNRILAEEDFFIGNKSDVEEEWLRKRFVFTDEYGNTNYFITNYHHFNNSSLTEFYCGTSILQKIEELGKAGTPYTGNISKTEADSILVAWRF